MSGGGVGLRAALSSARRPLGAAPLPDARLPRRRLHALQGDVHERAARAERHGLGHRLSVCRHQPAHAREGTHEDARQHGRRRASPTTGSCGSPTRRSSVVPSRWPPTWARSSSPTPKCAGLRAYLLKGGFLWVDDFWGTRAWAAVDGADAAGAAGVHHRRRAARPSDHAHDVRHQGRAAGDEHQLLAARAAATRRSAAPTAPRPTCA